jgi:hypothetical protein
VQDTIVNLCPRRPCGAPFYFNFYSGYGYT